MHNSQSEGFQYDMHIRSGDPKKTMWKTAILGCFINSRILPVAYFTEMNIVGLEPGFVRSQLGPSF